MNFENLTAQYLQGQGPLGTNFLRTVGLPPTGSNLETNYFDYRDAIYIPPTALGTITQQTQLFSKEIASDTVRSLKFPLTSDSAFVLYAVFCYADFFFPSNLTVETTTLYGPYLARAAKILLDATRLTMLVSNKLYLDTQVSPWANYELPNIVQPIQGQVANVPFAISPSTYQEHHRVYLECSPGIPWPANSSVNMNIITNVPAYVNDLTDSFPDGNTPWNIPIGMSLSFTFVGNQIRVVK